MVVGDKAKVEAFSPSHGVITNAGTSPPNVIIGKRYAFEPERVPPSAVPQLESLHVMAPLDIQKAGYHAGATYYELEAFVNATLAGAPFVSAVSAKDGELAVAIAVAAQLSIVEHRMILMDEVLTGPSVL